LPDASVNGSFRHRRAIIAPVRIRFLVLGTLLGGCSYSLENDIGDARAQIVDLERKIPPESPLWIFEGPDRFDAFLVDYDPGVPEFLYDHLLRKLDAMSQEEIDAQSKGEFDLDACSRDPALYRGKIWRVHGVIGEFHAEPVDHPHHPVPVAHAGVFFDANARPVLFQVTRKPDVLTLREDSVETRAVFVKWIEYTSRSGRLVTAPFFIGKTLRRYL
jgi:hypothetical protein